MTERGTVRPGVRGLPPGQHSAERLLGLPKEARG
ncbi:hypothetical protein SNOUR_05150 [Streptomyces noursei ATCC 11455]|nr:hypothetical protein SNOUR_05150 [Streptomyces noursei ATCC 11455]